MFRVRVTPFVATFVAVAAVVAALPARAEPLQELRDTLRRLSGSTPVKAAVQHRTEGRSQDEGETETNDGQASIQLEDGPEGLRLIYPQVTMKKAAEEDAARAANPKAPTPTATGLKGLDFAEVSELTRVAEKLQRELALATLKGERSEPWQGQPARVLVFNQPQAKKDKYVKKYESTLEVWLGADGVPLASRQRQRIEGSAFVFLNFEMQSSEDLVFAQVGDRLVARQRVTVFSGSGAGQKGNGRREYLLQIAR